jgi:hypothetical protein
VSGSKEIMVAGLWTFAIVALIGGIYGKLDGFGVFMFFIVAVAVSLGIVATSTSEHKSPKEASGT